MFRIINKVFHVTRGDAGSFDFQIPIKDDNGNVLEQYTFKVGDVIRFKVFKQGDCGCVEIQKDFIVEEENVTKVKIKLSKEDTKIGTLINEPKEYWYEIELNPETDPQTVIGYDIEGEKLFILYPEGSEKK